jgi:phosphonate transport system substrate-binding protein
MICNSEEETLRRFRPLTAYLSGKLGVEFEAVAIDTVDFMKHLKDLDFTHTNSLLYIMMHRFHGVEIVAAEKSGSLGARTRGAILTLKKSGLKSLKDLKDKTMIFGPALGPVSFMSQIDLLQRAGIDPEDDLASYEIPAGSFKHEKVVYGVLYGKYSAGAVPILDYERMAEQRRIDPEDFRVLALGDPILYCNFARTQGVNDKLAKRFRTALINLTKDTTAEVDGEVVKVWENARIDGYEIVEDTDFDDVGQVARRTNMPPYQKF